MSIPLPPLPRPDKVYSNRWGDKSDATYWYSPETLRARDQEIVRCVLEAAAKVCDHWSKQNHVYVNGALRCGDDIHALEFRHE